MRVILVAGTTRTAAIEGISAAGADPEAMPHTPSADAEIVTYGDVVRAPAVPVSPTGCPTPALVTRAARDVLGFDLTVVDGGLAKPTAAPTVDLGAEPGGDVREDEPVPKAGEIYESAREFGRSLPDDELVIGETIPGGTTTAMGVLRALGEAFPVSSSLPDNPIERKREVVDEALAAADADPGDFADDPIGAARHAGDPVLPAVAGIAAGALDRGAEVTLGGGTQLLAAAAMLRHDWVDAPLRLATTSFLAEDVDLEPAVDRLDLEFAVTDPGFDELEHVAARRYLAGEAKEGVGMGGALWLTADSDIYLTALRQQYVSRADPIVAEVANVAADGG
ncbi:MAG TPA: nicotinate-nucleotide--dimethylbenzimidazole phosphoribosyltransferase [Natrialbaceae archaeon]|nr:nicotinate-nucleotide--dimethylbenzimidazole phosphoribosyltransferase [Natrialbaceae archaeon]